MRNNIIQSDLIVISFYVSLHRILFSDGKRLDDKVHFSSFPFCSSIIQPISNCFEVHEKIDEHFNILAVGIGECVCVCLLR